MACFHIAMHLQLARSYNAGTSYMDHKYGRNVDSRLSLAWYGEGRKKMVQGS